MNFKKIADTSFKFTLMTMTLQKIGSTDFVKMCVNGSKIAAAGNYMFKVNYRNTRTRCEMFKVKNKGTRMTPGAVLVPLLLTLNIFHTLF